MENKNLAKRYLYLAVGVFTMLFSGVLYAWSILKIPFKEELLWSDSALALNFTLTMCVFCLGSLFGSLICKKIGVKITLFIAAVIVAAGFVLTGNLNESRVYLLYITYAVLLGFGIGMAYNIVASTVSAWFPDKKGFCFGCLMMGFGVSTLLLGNVISALFESVVGWRKTYFILGAVVGAVLLIAAAVLKLPSKDDKFPQPKQKIQKFKENFEAVDYPPQKMIKRFAFWSGFFCVAFMAAVGNSTISFARDLMLSVGAEAVLATTLVGVLSLCNGLGRILTGFVYDATGRRATMLLANGVAIISAGIILVSVIINFLPLCIIGLCLTGISYGATSTISSTFVSAFYGQKHYGVNFSIFTFNLMAASIITSFSNNLFVQFGNYQAPFIMLVALALVALVLNFIIRKP